MVTDFNPYSTVTPLVRGMPTWVSEDEQARLGAYSTYEQMYWNAPDTFKLAQRGTDQLPIYIPNPMTVVDTTAHYLLKGLSFTFQDAESNVDAAMALLAFLDRERVESKLHIAKHSGVVRGDWLLHLTADPEMPEGRRLSLVSVDPGAYFPDYEDDDLDQLKAVNLVEQITMPGEDEVRVKKLRYEYFIPGGGGQRIVIRSEAIYELDGWAEPGAKPIQVTMQAEPLPGLIDTIPVYHFHNKSWQGDPFGSSELRAHERLFASVNQAITDQELALALQGLGVYATDAPKPTDDEGNELDWVIAPAGVIEHGEGNTFKRVEGVGSVQPMLNHIEYLESKLMEATGTSSVARGKVDVGVAESGIALAIKFLPTLAKIEERDKAGIARLKQFFFDWKMWHREYEGQDFTETPIEVELGEKLPMDRAGKVKELTDMLENKVISRSYYREEMAKLGYVFPDDMEQQIIREEAALTEALDMMGSRMETDAGGEDEGSEGGGEEA